MARYRPRRSGLASNAQLARITGRGSRRRPPHRHERRARDERHPGGETFVAGPALVAAAVPTYPAWGGGAGRARGRPPRKNPLQLTIFFSPPLAFSFSRVLF